MEDPTVFPPLNAGLNALAGVLLLLGYGRIRRGDERTHKRLMISAFGVSVAFLASYLYYHFHFGIRVEYRGADWGRGPYLALLLTHTVLAALVPFLALRTIWLGLKDRRAQHRRWARVTFPVWLYVSVTGVFIYCVLYVLTDSGAEAFQELGLTGARS